MVNKRFKGIQSKDIDNWKRGQISYFSKGRMQEDALKSAINVIYDYDAIVRPRGSFASSGIPDVPVITNRTGSPTVITNRMVNPSFEVDTTGWGVLGAATMSNSTTRAYSGSKSLAVVTNGTSSMGVVQGSITVTASNTYTASAYVYAPAGVTIELGVDFFNGGTYVSGSYGSTVAGNGSFQRITMTFTVTSTTNLVNVFFKTSSATTFYLDATMVTDGSSIAAYFDGSFTNTTSTDYAWTGAANVSTSTATVYTVNTIVPQPLAQDFAFKRKDGTEGLMNVFTDGTTAYLYVLKADLSGWTQFISAPFDKAAVCSMAQTAGKVVVGNGIDPFTYYDIPTDTIKRLVLVNDPTSTPTAVINGNTGTNALDYYYRVAFNGISGSTRMTPYAKVSSSTIRDTWGNAKSVVVDISGFALDPNAQSWNVYFAVVSTGTGAPTDGEYVLIGDSMPLTKKQFTDTGAVTLLKSAPVENSTAGIKAWYYVNISGRLWAIGDGIVYWGGNVGSELYFGSANGSDKYIINPDSAEKPMAIILGRDNSGTTCINLLTRTMAGMGAIWDIYATTNSITANGQTFSTGTYQFKKREGNDGTDAPFSVIHEHNNVHYLSMDGFKSTGVKPNVVGIQSTDIISSAIRDRVLNLTQSNLSKTYAAYYDEALYWTVAYGAQTNNEIWVYDILHGGIWSIWRIPADCIFRWASTTNQSPSLYIRQGNKLLRYYKNSHSHADMGTPFESYVESGMIALSEDNLEWMHLLSSIWQFDQAVGQVELTVTVYSKNGGIIKVNTIPFNQVSGAGITGGWDAIRVDATNRSRGTWGNRSWEETLADLLGFKDPSDKKVSQKIRKNAAYVSFAVRANTPDTYYELSHMSMLYTYIGPGVEFLSQKGVIKI